MSGEYAEHMTAAGFGAGHTIPELSARDVSMGRMVGEKHSTRRQVGPTVGYSTSLSMAQDFPLHLPMADIGPTDGGMAGCGSFLCMEGS